MPLTQGTKLGRFEIRSLIGVGGMGEVYRASDPKIGRDVAIKVLPADFSADKERVARFEQEAQTAGALNHPNILAIYDVDTQDEILYVVSELLEGEELRDRLNDGPLPLRKTIEYAQQIVSGLSAAHEKGIVHRDLKPENLFITKDDRVKILDFGLAKLRGPKVEAGSSEDATRKAITNPGVVMGTVGYMSPEQVRGQSADHRSDIFSFGLILYEMITGHRAFQHETMAETMAAILKEEPEELIVSNPNISPSLERIVRRCLEKKAERRFQSTADLGFALESLSAPTSSSGTNLATSGIGITKTGAVSSSLQTSKWFIGTLAVAAIGFAAFAGWLLLRGTVLSSPATHLSIPLPEGHNILSGPAISRDGRSVAFVSSDGEGRPQLYVRSLNEPDSRLLPGTEEANNPFFSPDGNWIAFYARNQLFKVRADGGAPVSVTTSSSNAGGLWTDDGTLIFKKTWNGGFDVVSENGGNSKPLILLDNSDDYAYTWPTAGPGTNEVLFASWGKTFKVFLFDMKTMTKRPVADFWRSFKYVQPGYLIGADDSGELRALKLPAVGEAPGNVATLVQGVDPGTNYGDARFDVSQNGTLVYARSVRDNRSLVIVDRNGKNTPISMPPGEYYQLRVSPDGRRVAVVADLKLQILDLERGTITPLVPELGTLGANHLPVWSPDGRTITFGSNHDGNWDIYSKPATGAGAIVPVLKQPLDQEPLSHAPDGTLLFSNIDPQKGSELWMLTPGGEPRLWLSNGAANVEARFSPDGRFVAYSSDSSGRPEVYVQLRDNPTDRVQVSASGGRMPSWSPNGKELYFRQGNVIMQTTVGKAGELSATPPVRLFDGGWTLAQWFPFEVMPNGQQFLMVQQPREAIQTRIEIVLNWFTALDQAIAENR